MVKALQAAVVSIGEEKLGFKKEDIGTHLIRSGAAMTMFLGEIAVYTILVDGLVTPSSDISENTLNNLATMYQRE